MYKNYIKIAWRNFTKHSVYSFINLSGLTIGMTCFILIALFVQYEVSFDSHHEKANNIYRVLNQQFGNEFKGTDIFAVTPVPLGTAIVNDFPEAIEKTLIESRWALMSKDDLVFNEEGIFAEKSIFDVFTIDLISGQGKEALGNPDNVILTESLAKKLFGNNSPLEETILFEREKPFVVKGVVADPPKNQHFKYSYIASFGTDANYLQNLDKWVNNCCHTYVVLEEGTDAEALTEKLTVYDKFTAEGYKEWGLDIPKFILQPLKDIHLYSGANMELSASTDIKYIYMFGAIALIILLLAAINYMNLATVRSISRAKEVGMTKVLGAKRSQLMFQFLGESFLFTLFSFLLALGFTILLLPFFNDLLDKDIPFSIVGSKWLLAGMFGVAFLIGGLSGLYPAVFLSGLSPIRAFRGNYSNNAKGSLLRNGLVVGQFSAAIILAVGSVIIYQQLQYAQHKNLGYNREHVIHVPYYQNEIAENEDVIRATLLNHPKISEISFSNQVPINSENQGIIDSWEGNNTNKTLPIYRSFVDFDYMDLFDMEMVEGRMFSEDYATDVTDAYIINEAAAKAMNWETSVGKNFDGGMHPEGKGTVIGVVKDYHLHKFDLAIEPLFISLRRYPYQKRFGQVIMKVNTEDFEETRDFITSTMNAAVPMVPFEVKFLDDTYGQMYDNEKRLGDMFNIFTLLALFIAAMGLYGLVSHSVLKRTKEIGIRKVLGSSVVGILSLISKDFIKLLAIALIISVPIAYYFMEQWLQDFTYRINIKWWVFALVGISAFAISLVTIGAQSIKAALANPVKSLRSE